MLNFFVIAAVALGLGAALGYWFAKSKYAVSLTASETARQSDQIAFEQQKELLNQQLNNQRNIMEQRLQEQKALLDETARKQDENLRKDFQLLAEKIMLERSENFEKESRNKLDAMLAPLKTKLDEFKNNAEITRKETLETNARLSEQIKLLMKSSSELSSEAGNLAKALRRDNKTQGNWGEMILDEILVSSGLTEGVHYLKQPTLTDETGHTVYNVETEQAMRPDVMVNYADGKTVIIDSKVSLSAYIDYVNSEDEVSRSEAAARHLRSVKSHVDELVKKNYSAYVKKSRREAVEFVVMFMPNEGAYELAIRSEVKLWQEAFNRKVLIVSPVNLMALLQLIHLGWKRYDQERNQQMIIDTASVLLERLYAFYNEFDEIGRKLENAADVYRKASDRLRGTGGKHSVVKKGEELRKLGVSARKKLVLPVSLQPDDVSDETVPDDPEKNTLPAADGKSV